MAISKTRRMEYDANFLRSANSNQNPTSLKTTRSALFAIDVLIENAKLDCAFEGLQCTLD